MGVRHSTAGAEARPRCRPDPFVLGSDGDRNTFLLILFYTQHLWSTQYSPWSNFFNIGNKIEKFVFSRSGQIGCFHHWDDLKLLEFWAGTGGPRIGFWGPLKERGRGQRALVRSACAARDRLAGGTCLPEQQGPATLVSESSVRTRAGVRKRIPNSTAVTLQRSQKETGH